MSTERPTNFFQSPSRLAAVAAVGCALALPAAAFADAGTPGVHSAQSSAYATPPPNAPTVLGQTPSSQTPSSTTSPGTTTTTPQAANAPTVAPSVPAASKPASSSGIKSIPFTGLAAMGVVLVALLLLGAGFVMRRAARATASE
jgi:hypothetical protein